MSLKFKYVKCSDLFSTTFVDYLILVYIVKLYSFILDDADTESETMSSESSARSQPYPDWKSRNGKVIFDKRNYEVILVDWQEVSVSLLHWYFM